MLELWLIIVGCVVVLLCLHNWSLANRIRELQQVDQAGIDCARNNYHMIVKLERAMRSMLTHLGIRDDVESQLSGEDDKGNLAGRR